MLNFVNDIYVDNEEIQAKKDEKDSQLRKHNEKYQELRKSNAKTLWKHRKISNDKIFYANSILYPIKNSFNGVVEFIKKPWWSVW